MSIDLLKFYQGCNPSKTLNFEKAQDRQYYIDFSSVRGGKIIEELRRTIVRLSPEDPTCQLFTGHIGCGKSTELLRLKAELESEGFHVVYFESSQDLEMADVDMSDILLAIARQVSENLAAIGIELQSGYFHKQFQEISEFLHGIELSETQELSGAIAQITDRAKGSPKLRTQLRQYLEPRTSRILQAINEEILLPATAQLKERGKQGLVAIVDNLDRVDNRPLSSGRSLPEYLFVDRGEQLRKLKCHLVYTIPLSLIFSHESEALKTRLGGGVAPKVLPMVPVKLRSGSPCEAGLNLLRQMILARAFPHTDPDSRMQYIDCIFDTSDSLDRLCNISGGHVRNLLGLIFRCLQREDPPFSRETIELLIEERRNDLILALSPHDWELLRQVHETKNISSEATYQTLLRSMFVFEYRHADAGRWFDINPILIEAKAFKQGNFGSRSLSFG
ncbi:ATP-binding protein [Phormidium sp. CCY1219]|uniref:ATP-binding protein n=1 Tax=Phormidium sp. CCY1219 TaxID=2886104 RepID=UPI002D1EE6DD|nr:ATP-binding protein [Phormidium sp. CCY1219]MEB3830712.1 ATP-binding protein [Phormidium sp. CCY1219]